MAQAAGDLDEASARRDQAAEYARVWRAFGLLERPCAHRADWARWVRGRGPHLLLLAPVDGAAVARAVGQVQRRLAGVDGLELHPPHFLHITVQAFGFLARDGAVPAEGELRPSELDDLVPRLERRLAGLPAFDVALGGANAFYSSVFLETHSRGCLEHAREAARTAAGQVIERVDPYQGFLFHLTLGYFGAGARTAEARAALERLRAQAVGQVRVEWLELVQVSTDQREPFPPLRGIARFPLRTR